MTKLKEDDKYRSEVHAARILSEYYGVSDAKYKDVVTLYFDEIEAKKRENAEGREGSEVPRLMVKQLWLWTIDESINLNSQWYGADTCRDNHYSFTGKVQQVLSIHPPGIHCQVSTKTFHFPPLGELLVYFISS